LSVSVEEVLAVLEPLQSWETLEGISNCPKFSSLKTQFGFVNLIICE